MKKIIFKLSVIIILLISDLPNARSQPPPPNTGHGQPNNQLGGAAAPVGSGTLLLLGLAVMYGGRKIYILQHEAE